MTRGNSSRSVARRAQQKRLGTTFVPKGTGRKVGARLTRANRELLGAVAAGGEALAERVRAWLDEASSQAGRPLRRLPTWMDGLAGLDMQWGEVAIPSEAGLEKTATVDGQCVRKGAGGRKTVSTKMELSRKASPGGKRVFFPTKTRAWTSATATKAYGLKAKATAQEFSDGAVLRASLPSAYSRELTPPSHRPPAADAGPVSGAPGPPEP